MTDILLYWRDYKRNWDEWGSEDCAYQWQTNTKRCSSLRWDVKFDPPRWRYDYVTSRCVDAGDTNSDWTGEFWPHGKWINMGAYGGTPQASMSLSEAGNVADLDNDADVDYADMGLFVDEWLCQEVLLPGDLDRNGFVDFKDLGVFCNNWPWEE